MEGVDEEDVLKSTAMEGVDGGRRWRASMEDVDGENLFGEDVYREYVDEEEDVDRGRRWRASMRMSSSTRMERTSMKRM